MLVDRNHDLVHRHFQLFRGGRDDANISLVGNQPVDVGFHHLVCGERFIDDPSEGIDRHLEDFVAAHFDIGLAGPDLLETVADTVRYPEQVFIFTVGMDMR